MKRTPLPRRQKPIKRSPIRKRSRVKASNPKRKKREFARCYHSVERVEFVRSLSCVSCGNVPSQNAHIENGGAGRKADYTKIVPMCAFAHAEYHNSGRRYCETTWDVDLDAEAGTTESRWLAYSGLTKRNLDQNE